jgi:hypothetical protein
MSRTRQPKFSDATLSLVRAAAHSYVVGGGGIVPDREGRSTDDAAEHIGAIEEHLFPPSDPDRIDRLIDSLGLASTTKDPIMTAVGRAANAREDAAFLFGTFVGLELAALAAPLTTTSVNPVEKGGRR